VAFYEREAFAGFDFEHDEYASDHLEDSYRESVEAAVREEIGDCVPQSFSARDLSRFLPTPGSRVAEVRYVYADGKSLSPGSVVVTGEQGERVTLTLR
jgi:hypothetical protein